MEERQAIARLKRGDLAGLEVLVKQYQVRAVQAACLIVHDRSLAEDIVQDAFIAVAEKIHQYDSDRPFAPWFFRSVVNASVKAAKKERRVISLDEMQEKDDISLQGLLFDPVLGPEELLEQEEYRNQVWQILNQLPPEQKATLVMHHFLDLSEAEMVEQLHKPKSTIKYWLRKARKKIGSFLHTLSATQKVYDDRPCVSQKEKGA